MEELKPCPFCGGNVTLKSRGEEHEKFWFIKCDSCGIGTTLHSVQMTPVETWNRRAAK